MAKLNEDENVIASQSKDEDKISDEALAIMQKSFADIDKLQNINTKEDVAEEKEIVEPETTNEETENSEDTEDVTEEVEVKKEKRFSKEDKVRKLQNDKYRAIKSEKEALKKVEQLERLLDEALHSGTYHYSKSALSDLDRAKQNKKIAIENGDVEGLIDADIELTKAIHAVNEIEKWAAEDKRKMAVEPVREIEPDYDTVAQEIAYDWLDSHPYLQPGSREYNAPLAKQVNAFINHLDRNLMKNNDMDLYFSEDYFSTIDAFIDENIKKTQARNGKSSTSNNHIGSVRHGNLGSVNGRDQKTKTMQLSADEKSWCINSGMSEDWLIKHKLLEAEKKQ